MNLQLLIFISLCYEASGKMGSGRGGGGARAGVGRSGMDHGSVRGSSVYSGGVRSGASGWKIGSSTTSNTFGSSSFRSIIFSPSYSQSRSPIFTSSLTHPMVISSLSRPMLYDNRQYYWSGSHAKENLSPSKFPTICEYQIGDDDEELRNVTFSNGTFAKSIFFGCPGDFVSCCGLYCCYDIIDYVFIVVLFGLSISIVCWFICNYNRKEKNKNRDQNFNKMNINNNNNKNRRGPQNSESQQAVPLVSIQQCT